MEIPQVSKSRAGTIVIVEPMVIIKWQNKTKAHYTSLGYKFTGNGKEFECRVNDLLPESHTRVVVQCQFCSKIRTVEYRELVKANHTFCRCCARANDLVGLKFNRLTVIRLDKKRGSIGQLRWICECECGIVKSVMGQCLVRGHTSSCGCYNRDIVRAMIGERSPHWNPTLTDEDRIVGRNHSENHFWKKAVMERDDYTCRVCGDNRSGNLRVHHLYSYTAYPEHQFDVNNGVTLCEMHHVEFHKWNGGSHVPCTPGLFQEWLYLI
jgi:hypothetical protein